MDEIITLDYGSGGKKTSRLIEKMIVPALDNPALRELGDGAVLDGAEKLVFSTDSFVVDPIFFPGGDIGKLSVCGTVNDIAMCGGTPKYLSCSFIMEEGFPLRELERIVQSIRAACEKAGVQVVTGDTKVVEKGRGDQIYINTAGVDELDSLPGIGPVLAQRIVDWRTENGPFTDAAQLLEVDGIGQTVLESIQDFIVTEDTQE